MGAVPLTVMTMDEKRAEARSRPVRLPAVDAEVDVAARLARSDSLGSAARGHLIVLKGQMALTALFAEDGARTAGTGPVAPHEALVAHRHCVAALKGLRSAGAIGERGLAP